MTEFQTESTLIARLDQGSLRDARRQLEDELTADPIEVEVSQSRPGSMTAGGARTDGGSSGLAASGGLKLDEQRNDLLERMVEELEMLGQATARNDGGGTTVVGGGLGSKLRGLLGGGSAAGAGLLGGSALAQLELGTESTLGSGWLESLLQGEITGMMQDIDLSNQQFFSTVGAMGPAALLSNAVSTQFESWLDGELENFQFKGFDVSALQGSLQRLVDEFSDIKVEDFLPDIPGGDMVSWTIDQYQSEIDAVVSDIGQADLVPDDWGLPNANSLVPSDWGLPSGQELVPSDWGLPDWAQGGIDAAEDAATGTVDMAENAFGAFRSDMNVGEEYGLTQTYGDGSTDVTATDSPTNIGPTTNEPPPLNDDDDEESVVVNVDNSTTNEIAAARSERELEKIVEDVVSTREEQTKRDIKRDLKRQMKSR